MSSNDESIRRFNDKMEKIQEILILSGVTLGIATLAISIVTLLINVSIADGKVDHCYVNVNETAAQAQGPAYHVIGHRSWRPDVVMIRASSAEEADRFIKSSANCSR